ncbi:hypothetical protein Salat_1755400 [Sesamum alatum]|uniref:Uncharacterized protein n=1 Tax=Sesamum alatum TaxID=300844 RepID=A0AAE2CKT5_9LAMI|nr:hypothetical protein Salat_1755400 [Sesamum alatum]
MAGQNLDRNSIVIDIKEELNKLPSEHAKPSIFKVDDHLRSGEWDNVYDPEIVAIGPYHHEKPHLKDMEMHKLIYLNRLLKRKNEKQADRYIDAVVGMEGRARKCYARSIDLSPNDFVKLMVRDGCFLIELLRYHGLESLKDPDDPILHERILSQLRHDIVLVENQLPFFVLNQLFNMTKSEDPNDDIISLTLLFVKGMFLNLSAPKGSLQIKKIDHLLGLIHDVWVLPFARMIPQENAAKNNQAAKWENINSASGLREAGIDFENANEYNSLMDIKFVRKFVGAKLKIPQLNIYYETESQIRNLVAYEQYLPDGEPRYVSDYTFFLHCLINTSDDVELLCRSGIIGNWLGNDEEVSLMFNRLGKTTLTSSNFNYAQVFRDVNKHYHSHRRRWWAELWKKYFDGPWSCAKFLAALAVLVLTFLQTYYTLYSYHHPKAG